MTDKEMTKENSKEKNKDRRLRKRSRLPSIIRYSIIASWGMTIALAVFFLLKGLGY